MRLEDFQDGVRIVARDKGEPRGMSLERLAIE